MKIYQVDAFTDKPFMGNPAGVCILDGPPSEEWMQLVAREMNLSETAFLVPEDGGYMLRWFTPGAEVDLCGHATLAAAHILWEKGFLAPGASAKFLTRSGLLGADRKDDWITLDFPALPAEERPAPSDLLPALGLPSARFVGKNRFDYLVEIESEAALRRLDPDYHRLAGMMMRGVIVTAPGSVPYHFVSRFFAPGVGIPEDPVTGSAHCCLGPYWQNKLGRNEFLACQASTRGGVLKVKVGGDRVFISGQAVTVLEGIIWG